jgi:glutathione synthase/RimK-type ligase-like ATP-grasp enzyme
VDLCYKRNGLAVIEINSSPGLFESICNVNVIGAIADLVAARIKENYAG